jgi:hypothetical protein
VVVGEAIVVDENRYNAATFRRAREFHQTAGEHETDRRKHERPVIHLAGFKGTLQLDGYGAYTSLAERGDVVLAFCWSHVRRRFYEIQAASPAPIAAEALVRSVLSMRSRPASVAARPSNVNACGSRAANRLSMH